MSYGTPRRAKNSLSLKKFIDRLNRGLPIFVAHGAEMNGSIDRHDDCRCLHWHRWQYPSNSSDGAEFILTSLHRSSDVPEGYESFVSLNDINVYRNHYNRNFAFRTRKAAEQFIQDIS